MNRYDIPQNVQDEIAEKFSVKREALKKEGVLNTALPVVSHVLCKPHDGCPIADGKPPTVETCFRHVWLPNRFRPKALNPTDTQLKKAVTAYLEYAGILA